MKKLLVVILTFLTSLTFASVPVIDLGAIAHLATQIELIKKELTQLDPSQWSVNDFQTLSGTLSKLGDTIKASQGLSYSSANIASEFKSKFPGYKEDKDYGQIYIKNAETTLNTLNGILQSANMTADQFTSENIRLSRLQGIASSSDGQVKLLQTSVQATAAVASQIQFLRQTMIAQSNAQTVYMANKLNNEAQSKANNAKTIGAGNTKKLNYGTYPIIQPKF